jgi:hypothetical protein
MTENIEERRPPSPLSQSFRRIALEILVGFIGVYAAFALTAYKERRDQVNRRHQIKRALIAEIREISDHERKNVPLERQALATFDSTVKAGTPFPAPFVEAVDQRGHVWEAMKQAGGLNLLDVPMFVRLSVFYNASSNMYAQYAQLRDISMHDILPRTNNGPQAFIDPRTHKAIPVLDVYRSGLVRITGFSWSLASDGAELIVQLARDTI